MAPRRGEPEEVALKLQHVEVLKGKGSSVAEAIRQIGATQQTYYPWRKERAMSAIGSRAMASVA